MNEDLIITILDFTVGEFLFSWRMSLKVKMNNFSYAKIDSELYIQQYSQFSEDEEQIKNDVKFWIDGVVNTSIAVIGLLINTIVIFILRTKHDLKHVSTGLFCGLLIADNLYLAVRVISNCYWNFDIHQLAFTISYVIYPMEKTFLTITIFSTVAIAHQGSAMATDFERYERISGNQRSRRIKIAQYALPVTISSFILNIPRFFCYENINGKVARTALRRNFHFVVVYNNFVINVLTVFGPITLLMFYNWNIYLFISEKAREIKEWKMDKKIRKRNKIHANILFIIIIMFIVCHLPRCFLKFYSGFYEPLWIEILLSLSRMMVTFHKSTTAIIYIVKNSKVQGYLKDFVKECQCSIKSSTNESENGIIS